MCMQIKVISYKVVRNRGNYESEHLEMAVEVEEGEDHRDVFLKLKQQVNILIDEPIRYGKPQEDPPTDF